MNALSLMHRQLEERRTRLRGFVADAPAGDSLVRLLKQVDDALDRLQDGSAGQCLVCHGAVDELDLLANPLLEYCLCALSDAQRRTLENDLGLARRIQTALLPDPVVVAPGWEAAHHYEPAGVVSGDYCDVWSPPDRAGSMVFAVGDVSGKGVPASLLMTHLSAAVRSLAGAGVPLAELVERVDDQLRRAAIPTHYATLVVGRLGRDGEVDIVNAGHLPPLVVRRGAVEAVEAGGLPVGLLPGPSREAERLRLDPGDALLLYTDGLTEARAADGEEYGAERLVRFLAGHRNGSSLRDLVRAVRADLAAFLDRAAPSDDLTVLALRRTKPA